MDNLRDRFATLDRVPMPDLWSDVEQRAARLRSAERLTSVTVRTPARSTGRRDRSFTLLAAAALLVALVAGAVAVGSGLVRLPAILPVPSDSPSPDSSLTAEPTGTPTPDETPAAESPDPATAAPTTEATASPSITPTSTDIVSGGPAPWIAFQGDVSGDPSVSSTLWAIRADGSGAHKIQDGLDSNVAWSHDGTRLLANTGQGVGRVLVAEVGDEIGPFVDTGFETAVNGQWEAFDFSPDDERVVFVQKEKCAKDSGTTASTKFGVALAVRVAETVGANCVVLSVLDLRAGTRTELTETLVQNQIQTQNLDLELPAWSPDGTKIAYTRHDVGVADTRELWIVNADGTNPSKVDLEVNVSAQEPRWSPDGTRISFTSETSLSDNAPAESGVYVVDLATGGLERVSIGSNPAAGNLCCAEWIDNDRLRVQGDGYRFWLGTLDGFSGESRSLLDLTDALAALGPSGQPTTRYAPGNPGRTFIWQPVPVVQP